MIYGIGTDIVKIDRISHIYQKYGDTFVRKILTSCELQDWQLQYQHKKISFLAKRFAAKEAFAKAMQSGLRYPVSLQEISITHNENGSPKFEYSQSLQIWLNNQQISTVHLSLSDEKDYVIAFAIAEKL